MPCLVYSLTQMNDLTKNAISEAHTCTVNIMGWGRKETLNTFDHYWTVKEG